MLAIRIFSGNKQCPVKEKDAQPITICRQLERRRWTGEVALAMGGSKGPHTSRKGASSSGVDGLKGSIFFE
jgi:hypothetical protein